MGIIKLFKTVDEKFAEIGFIKLEEGDSFVSYARYVKEYGYIQELHLQRKISGKHLIQSYDPELFDKKMIGNTGVGLTMYEVKLCVKKMRQKGWKIQK